MLNGNEINGTIKCLLGSDERKYWNVYSMLWRMLKVYRLITRRFKFERKATTSLYMYMYDP